MMALMFLAFILSVASIGLQNSISCVSAYDYSPYANYPYDNRNKYWLVLKFIR